MQVLVSLLVGLVFGLGLIVSGMSAPAKVLGFLDLAGPWDPSLTLVMAGGIAMGLPPFAVAKRRRMSLLRAQMNLPSSRGIDARLVTGSVLFGIGWGIAGLCPGPVLVALGTGSWKAAVFVAAMLTGMRIFETLQGPQAPPVDVSSTRLAATLSPTEPLESTLPWTR